MNNIKLKTNLFRVRYRRNDGTKQLKILAKVGYNDGSKFNELKRFEITVRDKFQNIYLVTDHQYERLRALPPSPERLYLFQIETEIKRIILQSIEEKRDITTKDINDKLYSKQAEQYRDLKVKSWNDFLREINHGEVEIEYQKEEIDRIESAIEQAIADKKILTEEDIDNIKDSVGVELQIEKERNLTSQLTLDERYARGKFDGIISLRHLVFVGQAILKMVIHSLQIPISL
ncbi:MAG: hypothetical protein ACP5E3_15365 [Bacteroidales bacterium]